MKEVTLHIDETGRYLEENEVPVMWDIDGVPIYEGDAYYQIGGYIYSEETLEYYRSIA